jgi:hypothetical protein
MKPKASGERVLTMRAYVELKNGSFRPTEKVLQNPDIWPQLVPNDRRRVKRYAATTTGGGDQLATNRRWRE